MAEWDVRQVDQVWDEYTRAIEELAASGVCDVLAHPDLVKIARRVPAVPDEFYDRITEAAVRSGMAAELSSAGWRKPIGEEYPAPPLLKRFVDAGVPLTTASDAHSLPDVADRAEDLRDLFTPPASPGCRGSGIADPIRSRWPRRWKGSTGDHPGRTGLPADQPRRLPARSPSAAPRDLGHPGRLLLFRPGPSGPDGGRQRGSGRDHPGRPRTDAAVQQRHRGPARPGGPDRRRRGLAPGHRHVESGEVTRGEIELDSGDEPVRLHCIPVRCEVVGGRAGPAVGRGGTSTRPSRADLSRPLRALGHHGGRVDLPFPSEEVATEEAPRVGDGVVLVDEEGQVRYASPNATNALHRMGMYSHIEGRRLTELGIEESAIEWALASALPVVEEVERRPDVTVLIHCIPLLADGK